MNSTEIQLPADKRFGVFFGVVFLLVGVYLYWNNSGAIAIFFLAISACVTAVAYTKAVLLRPLNIGWMKLGFFLGSIVSPLVMGLIFFAIFAPVAICMRLFGRDELRLRCNHKSSYWRERTDSDLISQGFSNQF